MHTTRKVSAWLLASVGWLIVAMWVVGRVLTDQFHATQYVYWAPTAWVVAPAGGLAFLAVLAGIGLRGWRFRWGLVAGVLLVAAHMAVVERRAFRGADVGLPGFVMLSWNASNVEEDTVRNVVERHSPDLAGVMNAPWGADFRDLPGGWANVVHSGPFLLASRDPVTRWGIAGLGIEAEEGGFPYGGLAMFAEITGPEGPFVVWIIDLPSDPRLARRGVTAQAARVLGAWVGSVFVRDGEGWRTEKHDPPGFPRADVVMGDFNIPRGSASLSALTEGMADAFTQAGTADPATWPRGRPWWALDQVFVRSPRRATWYSVHDPGEGDHRLVVTRVTR